MVTVKSRLAYWQKSFKVQMYTFKKIKPKVRSAMGGYVLLDILF